MILKQYYLGCLSHASYLIGDADAGVAAVVDPQRDVDEYLADAAKLGVSIRHVLLTHFHADFVAGHLELRERLGAKIHLGARAEADYAFHGLADGDAVELGRVRVVALETPGHTPESTSFLVYDGENADPHAVLTGDTLFIGDVGRPDLMASVGVSAEELGGMLYDSLREKLMTLPDATLVYPAHGAGSMCGKNLSTETVSTIGDQKRFNYALQPMEKEEFVRIVAANQPCAPRYFPYDAQLNREERGTLEESLADLKALDLEAFRRAEAAGAQVVDVREAPEFAAGHLPGSVNVGLEGRFATWAGSVLGKDTPLLLVTPAGREREAALRLGRIGFDRVLGYLAGGAQAFDDGVTTTRRVGADALGAALESDAAPVVLDVRQPGEREASAIEGSLHVPLGELEERLGELPRDAEIVIHCATGYRSMAAASLLERAGFARVADLEGGIEAWSAAAV